MKAALSMSFTGPTRVDDNQWTVSEDRNSSSAELEAQQEVRKILEREQKESGGKSANSRLVRNVFEIALEHQANRVAPMTTLPNDDDLQR